MNIIFFGSDNFAVVPLEALVAAGYAISCVVTQPDRAGGRGLKLEATPLKALAKKRGLKIYQPGDVNSAEAQSFLRDLNPDLFIVIAYGQILSQGVINIPKIFAINAHASMLPKYRGAAPINWAIIKGEKYSGVTIMKIVHKLDAGPVIQQQAVAISGDDTAITLQDKLSTLAAGLLLDSLVPIKNNNYKLLPQDEAGASLAPKLKKSDGLIEWSKNAEDIRNLIRGCLGWPGAFTYYKGKLLKIYKAKVSSQIRKFASSNPGEILEACKEGIVVFTGKGNIIIEELQLEGKKIMKAGEFISGHRITVGEKLGGKN
ncbi:MAG: methionyl-tRNA formyltransferase [Candidatus Omnitrophota bacterium]|nr:methionyl-tRNA formyltransferase [Candidatus Omnitrophota bacterium]